MKFALLLLLAVSRPVVLTDDVYQLPAKEWRWVRFEIRQRPAVVRCLFEAISGGEVHAELVSRADLDLIRARKVHDSLAVTDTGRADGFMQYVRDPGEYAVVIENEGSRPTATRLTVSLAFNDQPISEYLSPERRLAVILISSIAFFAIVTFSARALLKAMKSGQRPRP